MSATPRAVPEPLFDRTAAFAPGAAADGPPDPVVYDGSVRALRQRTVNFAAKRMADMMYVTGLDRATAERHLRWRAATIPGGLAARPAPDPGIARALEAAREDGRLAIDSDDRDQRVTVRWTDPAFGPPVAGSAIARPGYGGILLGPRRRAGLRPRPDRAGPGHAGAGLAAGRRGRARRPARLRWKAPPTGCSPPRPGSTACWSPRRSGCCSSATAASVPPTAPRQAGR